jgi:hypothetical protein
MSLPFLQVSCWFCFLAISSRQITTPVFKKSNKHCSVWEDSVRMAIVCITRDFKEENEPMSLSLKSIIICNQKIRAARIVGLSDSSRKAAL